MVDTAIKEFRRGTVLRYDYFVYNAVLDAEQKADLTYRLRLYHNGQIVFQSEELPLSIAKYESSSAVSATGTLQLGSDLCVGDYILHAEITDKASSSKNRKVDQFVQFEIVE